MLTYNLKNIYKIGLLVLLTSCGNMVPKSETTNLNFDESEKVEEPASTDSSESNKETNRTAQNTQQDSLSLDSTENASSDEHQSMEKKPVESNIQKTSKTASSNNGARKLAGSCRLFFDDNSVKCREIHTSSKSRFIAIAKKHCNTVGNGYTGIWSEKACPRDIWNKERVGGCWSENQDYSSIGYSYVGRDDALAKSMLPLLKSTCNGKFIED